ncbi:MAG: DUF2997 domain-containing protein [Planctomycetota bacterium]
MNTPEFEITISRSGKVSVEISGAKGPRCLKYAELLKEIVGHEQERRLTGEFYEPETRVRFDTEVRQRHGS